MKESMRIIEKQENCEPLYTNILNKERGITLIALVVTIVVLLILAGVSLNLVLGDNGIITKAKDAKIETRAASVEDRKNLWKLDESTDEYATSKAQTLEELVDELQQENLVTEDEKNEILDKGHVVIGSKDIPFSDGLIKSTYTITNSNEKINFNKIILEGDILIEKPDFQNYSIEGISNSKEGNYISTGSVDGKSGNLEIVGDIKDATFKYNLTDFMKGDEVFYCKVNIDGESYYKEIEILQGSTVIYEEDFQGITYSGDYWTEDTNENYTNGKAKVADSTNASAVMTFSYTGSGCEIISRLNQNTGRIGISDNNVILRYRVLGSNGDEDEFQANITGGVLDNLEYGEHSIEIWLSKKVENVWGNLLYVDAIEIHR